MRTGVLGRHALSLDVEREVAQSQLKAEIARLEADKARLEADKAELEANRRAEVRPHGPASLQRDVLVRLHLWRRCGTGALSRLHQL